MQRWFCSFNFAALRVLVICKFVQYVRRGFSSEIQSCGSMNLAQVSIGGKDVLVPVTTIGSLATGAVVTSTLQPWRSMESGEVYSMLLILQGTFGSIATLQ